MTDWVRLWHDMPTDPKWRVIARKSGQPLPCVIAVFNLMLVNASANAAERGTLSAWSDEDAAAALDLDEADVAAIYAAMQGKVLDGNRLTGWERRQPKREDDSRERVKKHRAERKRSVTQGNAPEAETDEDTEGDPPLPPFGLNEAIELWNAMAERAKVPKCRGLNDQRTTWFKERLAEHGEAGIREAIGAVERSAFCRGQNDRKWRADFGFMVQAKSFLKLIEGSFDDGPSAATSIRPASDRPRTADELDRAATFQETEMNNPAKAAEYREEARRLRATVRSGTSIGEVAAGALRRVGHGG